MNLTAYLLDSPRPCTADELRQRIRGYGQSNTDAFRRMFERDKETLRELEVPLEVVRLDGDGGAVDAYYIDDQRYRMPDPGLTPEEQAALMIAIEAVQVRGTGAGLGDVSLSPIKLGIEAGSAGSEGSAVASVNVDGAAILEFFSAVTERREVRFTYRAPGEEAAERSLQPMSLANVSGRWYVGGTDIDREALRIYRVDRVIGEVISGPAGAFEVRSRPNIRAQLGGGPWTFGQGDVKVKVRFDPEVVWRARNIFRSAAEFSEMGTHVDMTLHVAEPANLIESVLAFGRSAEVVEPPSLRSGVIAHLKALVT